MIFQTRHILLRNGYNWKARGRMKDDFFTNMQLVKEGKLVCKQKKCRFYHDCDNYNCSYLELAEPKEQTNEK